MELNLGQSHGWWGMWPVVQSDFILLSWKLWKSVFCLIFGAEQAYVRWFFACSKEKCLLGSFEVFMSQRMPFWKMWLKDVVCSVDFGRIVAWRHHKMRFKGLNSMLLKALKAFCLKKKARKAALGLKPFLEQLIVDHQDGKMWKVEHFPLVKWKIYFFWGKFRHFFSNFSFCR